MSSCKLTVTRDENLSFSDDGSCICLSGLGCKGLDHVPANKVIATDLSDDPYPNVRVELTFSANDSASFDAIEIEICVFGGNENEELYSLRANLPESDLTNLGRWIEMVGTLRRRVPIVVPD